jgi:uncharacterized membrane protein
MLHLANFTLIIILWLNLFGLSLATGAITKIRNGWLNLTLGPWLFCSIGFFLEFIHGFGNLQWIWPITTLASLALIFLSTRRDKFKNATLRDWQRRIGFNPWRHPGPYLSFILVFSYALVWRYAYPDVDASSEKIADLSFICSYLPGPTLPAPDVWLHPYLSTQYYSFQYYAAALMGRILGMDPGTTYNLGFCALIGLAGTAAVGLCRETVKSIPNARKWSGWLVPVSWILGGSGVSGIIHLMTTHITFRTPMPWVPMRFIGSAILDKAPIGTFLDHYQRQWNPTTLMDLPGEPFAYSIYLGDYHPTLSGYYVALVAVLALTLYHREKLGRNLAIAGACLSWSIVSDTWNLPLELLALGAWCLYNFRDLLTGNKILCLAAGALAGYATIYPYFRYFAFGAGDYNTSLKLVKWTAHTPPLLFLLFLFPPIGLSVLSLFSRDKSVICLGRLGLGLLFFGEFFYINDIYSGQFERFNTTLKWWPWISALILLTLGVRLLSSPRWWIFVPALFFIGYPLTFTYDLAASWWQGPKDHVGQLAGQSFLLNDDNRGLFAYLKALPRGVTLEDPEADESFTNQSAMSLFAGQPCYMGWEGHELLWRAFSLEIRYRYAQMKLFYSGAMPAPAEWLKGQDIEYVLWFKSQDQEAAWAKINAAVQGAYRWHDSSFHGTQHIGIWIKN